MFHTFMVVVRGGSYGCVLRARLTGYAHGLDVWRGTEEPRMALGFILFCFLPEPLEGGELGCWR